MKMCGSVNSYFCAFKYWHICLHLKSHLNSLRFDSYYRSVRTTTELPGISTNDFSEFIGWLACPQLGIERSPNHVPEAM